MPGIAGYIGREPDALRCVLSVEGKGLRESVGAVGGWGLGCFQGGDVLLRSRPGAPADVAGFLGLLEEAGTTAFVARFDHPQAPAPGRWDVQPFRYRQWVWAQEGSLRGFEAAREQARAIMPGSLRRSLRGTSDAEWMFHLFLSFLFDAGKLETQEPEPAAIVEAMKHTLEFLVRSGAAPAPAGACGHAVGFIVSNGAVLAGYNGLSEGRIGMYERRGACDECQAPDSCVLRRGAASPRASVVLMLRRLPPSFDPGRYAQLPVDSFFVVTQEGTTEIVPGRTSVY